jgi:hypothetical protein
MSGFLNEKDCQVVAVCDVKKDQFALARDIVNKHYNNQNCATYHDFRDLVSRKDIYLEKPLALTLAEGQALRKAVRRPWLCCKARLDGTRPRPEAGHAAFHEVG